MPEAEVSIRLAHYLINSGHAKSEVSVAIDGAQIKTGDNVHFSLVEFMQSIGWIQREKSTSWQSVYVHKDLPGSIKIHCQPGQGDIQAKISGGTVLVAEAKKGTLTKSKSSQEYPLMREAIGQLMTIEKLPEKALLAIAVPHSPKFEALAIRWREAPLIRQARIQILTVSRSGEVHGLNI